jgi:AcrR family transcriptional regulator
LAEEKKEKAIKAARQVFLRYGFKRVTMNDLAEAAQMSRPALYLVFSSKEEAFTAVMNGLFQESLAEIRVGLGRFDTPKDKITYAFEIWCVRPFEFIQKSPDAKDILESSYEFAASVTTAAADDFVDIIAGVIEPLFQKQSVVNLTSIEIARVLAGAVPGFKASSTDATDLRKSIENLLSLVLAGLQTGQARLCPLQIAGE